MRNDLGVLLCIATICGCSSAEYSATDSIELSIPDGGIEASSADNALPNFDIKFDRLDGGEPIWTVSDVSAEQSDRCTMGDHRCPALDEATEDESTFEPALDFFASETTVEEFGIARWQWALETLPLPGAHVLGRSSEGTILVDVYLVPVSGAESGYDMQFRKPSRESISVRVRDGEWTSPDEPRFLRLASALIVDNEIAHTRAIEQAQNDAESGADEGEIRPHFLLELFIGWALGSIHEANNPPPPGTQRWARTCIGGIGQCAYFSTDTFGTVSCEPLPNTEHPCACFGYVTINGVPNGCPGMVGGTAYAAPLTAIANWCTHDGAALRSGDFNGDGRSDLMCRDASRLWFDYADAQGRLTGQTDWHIDTSFCTHSGASLYVEDINGDGRTDLFCRDSSGRMWIDYANQEGRFGSPDWSVTSTFCTHRGAKLFIEDLNADRRADLLCRSDTRIWADHADSLGRYGIVDWVVTNNSFCTHSGSKLFVADVNADGRGDLVCHDSGGWIWIDYAHSSGTVYRGLDWYRDLDYCTHSEARLYIEDATGDRRADLVCEDPNGQWIDFANSSGRFDGPDWYHAN
jgi:hypothetical protein